MNQDSKTVGEHLEEIGISIPRPMRFLVDEDDIALAAQLIQIPRTIVKLPSPQRWANQQQSGDSERFAAEEETLP